MKIIRGDLIAMAKAGEFDAICHGANCFHTMGSGIAKQIAEHFPTALCADKMTVLGDVLKVGDFSWAPIFLPDSGKKIHVVNLYTQFMPGACFEYAALYVSFLDYAGTWRFEGEKIGVPWIGCGIGGGVKKHVQTILEACERETGLDLTVVEFSKLGDDA